MALLFGCNDKFNINLLRCSPDYYTWRGIPVHRGKVRISKWSVKTYLDHCYSRVKEHFPGYRLHRNCVKLRRHTFDGNLSGRCSKPLLGDPWIEVVWYQDIGAKSYTHELFHKLGFSHDGDGVWGLDELNDLEDDIHDEAYEAIFGI